jgi:hypothetical protein
MMMNFTVCGEPGVTQKTVPLRGLETSFIKVSPLSGDTYDKEWTDSQ